MMPDFSIEDNFPGKLIAGIDEAGRGPLCGPVVAAAVIVDRSNWISGINDSKKIPFAMREKLFTQITQKYQWAVGIVSPEEIDQINILEATKKACVIAANGLKNNVDIILVDGNMKFPDTRFNSIVKGDSKSYSIAAASIIAKVTRDRLMLELHAEYPHYGWNSNFGYGTKVHVDGIRQYGLSPHHRRSFKVKSL